MRPTHHWHLFCLATTWWTLFFVWGLSSNYFQTYTFWPLLILSAMDAARAKSPVGLSMI